MAVGFQLCWNWFLLVLSMKLHVSNGLFLHKSQSTAFYHCVALFQFEGLEAYATGGSAVLLSQRCAGG